jgi:hypothetical protein
MALSLDGTTGISCTGNIVSSGGIISATGNIYGGNIIGTIAPSAITVTGNANVGNLFSSGVVSSTGNITGGNILGGANVNATTHTGTTVSVTANITGGNVLTGGLISATSTITSAANVIGGNLTTAGQLVSSVATGTAPLSIASTTLVPNLYVARANVSDWDAISTVTTGTYYVMIASAVTGNIQNSANSAITVNAATGALQATIVSATGNVIGGNLTTGGLISATGAITGAAITGTSLTVSTGNVTLGNLVNSGSNATGNIGSATTYFNTVFAKATSALYADLAENYEADANYEPGTVLEFGGDKEVTQTTSSHRTQVAGIVSTNPSYLMNSGISGDKVVAVALTGRVPCYVIGNIVKGDRLVSSNTLGVATVLDITQYQPGCIIGKALENYNSQEIGRIEVAVGRF